MSSSPTASPAWMVINQSQSPFHQDMLDQLATHFGPCLLYTGTPFREISDRLRIRRAPPYNRKNLVSRCLSWLRFSLGATWLLLRTSGRVPVLVVTNPPLLPLIAWFLGWLRRRPYAVLVWDLYPEHLVAIGWFRSRNPIVSIWRRVNRSVYRRARSVITIGHRMAAAIQDTAGSHVPVAVIPNWADTEWLRPLAKADNAFAQQYRQVDKVTVMYSGNLGATHAPTVIADVAQLLQDESQVSFLVIGDGLGRAPLQRRVTTLGLQNIRILGYQAWDVIPQSLACADIALILQDAASSKYSLPSKVYSFLATGSAILAVTPADSDLHDLVAHHQAGVVVTEPQAILIASAIRRMLRQPSELRRFRDAARCAAESHFTARVTGEQLRKGLQPLMSGD